MATCSWMGCQRTGTKPVTSPGEVLPNRMLCDEHSERDAEIRGQLHSAGRRRKKKKGTVA